MKATITFSNGEIQARHEIHGSAIIGRSSKNQIRLTDPAASGKHCAIFFDENRGFIVRDLCSSNGTFVNGKRIGDDTILADGDVIRLGETKCVFSWEEPVGSFDEFRHSDNLETHIQSQVAPGAQANFLPEAQILDEKHLRTDYEKLRVTYELQRDIGLEMNIDKILKKILSRTYEFLKYDRGVILLVNERGNLQPRVFKGRTREEKPFLSKTLIHRIQMEKKGVLSLDAFLDTRFKDSESLMAHGIRSTMGVPVVYRDEMLGAIIVDSSTLANAYSEKDLHLLSNIADRSAQIIKISQMAKKIEKDAITRERFQRLLSPNLAELVVSGKLEVKKGGQSVVASVLFADIRGFTAMSENMKAGDVLKMLNSFFEVMVECVFRHQGTVDKFLGDGMMVIWGAPVLLKSHAGRAVKAALDMRNRLKDLNLVRLSRGERPLEIGIGINTGELVAGYLGSSRTMSYSVIGDTVNTASRLCSAAKPGQIVISETTRRCVANFAEVVELTPIKAKGKQDPVTAYNVLGLKPFHGDSVSRSTPEEPAIS